MISGMTGIVLAGGRSSRFGTNKALADWRGMTLIESVVNSLLKPGLPSGPTSGQPMN